MKDLRKSISLNAWYSNDVEWTQMKSRTKDNRDFQIKYNRYGFITNPYLKGHSAKAKSTTNENDFA